MTERCCETCVHYPPSSFGGKPCSCCEPSDPMTSCWDWRPEGENDCSDSNGYYILDGELLHDFETILDLCANYAGCHTGIVEGAFSEIEDMLGSLIFDIKQHQATDVVPVRRGRWLKTDAFPHRVYCSECYATYVPNDRWQIWQDKPGEGGLQRTYCPACGAKMEEDYEP